METENETKISVIMHTRTSEPTLSWEDELSFDQEICFPAFQAKRPPFPLND